MAQIKKFFHVRRSIRITPPHKRNFWSPKLSASIHHQVHANVSERHVPLRLLHPCSLESERNTNTCNCCSNANAWKRHIPSRLLHLCSSESECKPTPTIVAMQMPKKGTSPQDSFTYVLQNQNENAHICLKLQPVIDDNLDLWLIIPVYMFLKHFPRVYNHTHWSSLHENAKNRLRQKKWKSLKTTQILSNHALDSLNLQLRKKMANWCEVVSHMKTNFHN